MTYSTALAKHLSIVWLLLLLGCQYEPDGEFFKDIDDSRVSRPSIQLKDALGVIPLNEKTSFSYDIVTSRAHFRTEVFFDGKTIDYTDKDYGDRYFILDPQDYGEGQYSLRIVTAVGSGTGSLADKVDAEYIQSERTWEVIIERPEPVNIKTVSIDSGSIRLEWEAYQPLKIEKFLFYEIVDYYEGYGRSEVLMKIEDPTVTSAYDSAFILGERNYRIRVVTEHHSIYGETYEYSLTEDIGLRTHLEGDSLKVRWNQPALYSNVNKYEVSVDRSVFHDRNHQNTITTAADRRYASFHLPDGILFGEKANVKLTLHSSYGQQTTFEKDTLVGKKIKLDGDLFFSPYTDTYYIASRSSGGNYSNSRYLDRSFDTNLNPIDDGTSHSSRYVANYPPRYCLSPDGKVMYAIDYSVSELAPYTLEETRTYDAREIFRQEGFGYIGRVSVSNNHILLANVSGESFVVDMKDTSLLMSFPASVTMDVPSDGEFLLAADTLYKRTGQDYTFVSVIDGIQSNESKFSNNEEHHLITAESATIKVYDCQSLSFIQTLSLPSEIDYLSVDSYSKLIGGYEKGGNIYYVVDMETTSVESIRVSSTLYGYSPPYFILNSNLFANMRGDAFTMSGFYLDLTENE